MRAQPDAPKVIAYIFIQSIKLNRIITTQCITFLMGIFINPDRTSFVFFLLSILSVRRRLRMSALFMTVIMATIFATFSTMIMMMVIITTIMEMRARLLNNNRKKLFHYNVYCFFYSNFILI